MRRNICWIVLGTAIAVILHTLPARAGRWTTYTTEDGLADNIVTAILEDREGNLWFGTPGGVTRYRVDRVAARDHGHRAGYDRDR